MEHIEQKQVGALVNVVTLQECFCEKQWTSIVTPFVNTRGVVTMTQKAKLWLCPIFVYYGVNAVGYPVQKILLSPHYTE